MSTKGEEFAGMSVAIVTPFRGGEVDYGLFAEQIEFQVAAGTCWSLSGRHNRRVAHAKPRRARTGHPVCG